MRLLVNFRDLFSELSSLLTLKRKRIMYQYLMPSAEISILTCWLLIDLDQRRILTTS